MTPSEKAKALVEKFLSIKLYNKHAAQQEEIDHAKQCAIICADEILKLELFESRDVKVRFGRIFWQSVKTEIEKL